MRGWLPLLLLAALCVGAAQPAGPASAAPPAIGRGGRSGRPLRLYVVISEPDGLVITAYPGS